MDKTHIEHAFQATQDWADQVTLGSVSDASPALRRSIASTFALSCVYDRALSYEYSYRNSYDYSHDLDSITSEFYNALSQAWGLTHALCKVSKHDLPCAGARSTYNAYTKTDTIFDFDFKRIQAAERAQVFNDSVSLNNIRTEIETLRAEREKLNAKKMGDKASYSKFSFFEKKKKRQHNIQEHNRAEEWKQAEERQNLINTIHEIWIQALNLDELDEQIFQLSKYDIEPFGNRLKQEWMTD